MILVCVCWVFSMMWCSICFFILRWVSVWFWLGLVVVVRVFCLKCWWVGCCCSWVVLCCGWVWKLVMLVSVCICFMVVLLIICVWLILVLLMCICVWLLRLCR